MDRRPNRLAQETSPYLLQHAYNPVDWYPWGEEALQQAQTTQKPILVSIGYAACHWCHVMERESFENPQVAAVMNAHFVCIKVDREERPDVDHVYLQAVHAMGVQGGWPLNVFLTPEAKPFYGGTYFSPGNWLQLLTSIGQGFAGEYRAELHASAEQFTRVLQASELEKYRVADTAAGVSDEEFKLLVYTLAAAFDRTLGGLNRAPKFPTPSIWRFLLHAHALSQSPTLLTQLTLTLRHMAWGGLYDQVGGGFARYSVDAEWHVPHFEKMLYDNGQLLSLYAEAFQVTGEKLYHQVLYDTVGFLRRELLSPTGGFYSSLDADSEGEEGLFYVWTLDELRDVLGPDLELAAAYYGCTAAGNWEHGRNILQRSASDEEFARQHELTPAEVEEVAREWQLKLLAARAARPRPALDDKILTGWNALALQGLLDAYRACAEPQFLELALQTAAFIRDKLTSARYSSQGSWLGLLRSFKNERATIDGFLEDYALVIQAYLSLYEATFAEEWLQLAAQLTETTLAHFFDPNENLFFFTAAAPGGNTQGSQLITRPKELLDNVVPASNSVMAHNLHRLGLHLESTRYLDLAATMLRQVQGLVLESPQSMANWARLYTTLLRPTAEVAIVGPDAEAFRQELSRHYLPNTVLAGTVAASPLPLLQGRLARNGHTTIYVCFNRACQQPVHSVAEALAQL
ncbi:thioredoxin domain-containing protein [Hymenobacter sp. HSC-4F20]|uniref:thioredoxin domain-containing protein n=1 Tax=Hymenobacter sp. HSC-4F20 TaxID=2864135 RepID=UPI001C73C8FC|nr:thioredoxin domain-containing protein [Hymenobacter sp. HSC-4F20]MBX0290772.1 thioredoxin domain-containing protein [Hymenobacter sp. HSC-4F20]